jgi:hypothetical protein
MPVVEAVQTFVGIVNENEFYSHHYLSDPATVCTSTTPYAGCSPWWQQAASRPWGAQRS